MEVVEVLHMNGGTGDASYASNSLLQKKVILLTKPITEEAITELYTRLFPKSICIADMGCSSGPNTFLAVSELIKNVEKKRTSLGHESPEYQIHLNDLPSNDFNTIFRSLPSFQKSFSKQMGSGFGHCFFTGVPGSFYGRLFPNKSLHFVHSSYSLMWLSRVPDLEEVNKGNIYLSSTSPLSVIRAYLKQFQRDFTTFLQCRAEELVPGGVMVLTLMGRKGEDHSGKESGYALELLARALNELVSEGQIEEEQLDCFNVPQYTPSPAEVKYFVEEEGSFSITRLEATTIHWTAYDHDHVTGHHHAFKDGGYSLSNCVRAVVEPLLVRHFGEAIMDEVFHRYREILTNCMTKEKIEFINVTVSMKRRV
uniref:S-adenosyl-L-methionine:salicylic acid carboxyl methyltransferase n=1 Tax=Stephanotis floribunda TaxID=2163920 RepID=Q9AVR1_STEFL|nr:S-adenosyl-L-methionine:salicylic acid carboxyl methyltransferase [Marsdenia floribunda]